MKLIDILVQELPKRGGWPEGIHALVQSSQGSIYKAGGGFPFLTSKRADDWELAEVTREQYEYALAAAKSPVVMLSLDDCDGSEYLGPVVGREMECHAKDGTVFEVVVVAFDGDLPVVKGKKHGNYFAADPSQLKTIRSEAERKRDIAIKVMKNLNIGDFDDPGIIYDAIAAGNIPGVRIE